MNNAERLDDAEEALRLAIESAQASMWTALPGTVVSADLGAQTVSVQPTVQGSVTDETNTSKLVNLPLLVDVPIVWPRAGGFALTFPVAVGDEVLVVFASRCIDAWWQSGGIGAPAETRMHDLSDGFAILAPTSQPKKLSNVSTSNVQLRNASGSTVVEITTGGAARIIGASSVDIQAPTINLTGNVVHTGGTFVSGGVTFGTHRHGGITTGGGISGGPTP